MIFKKRIYFRNKNHLINVASLPCQLCGAQGESQAAHSNWSQWGGKGKSIKSSDEFTAALCQECHYKIDQGSKWSRDQRKEAWTLAHVRTVKELTESNKWPVDIPIPEVGQ